VLEVAVKDFNTNLSTQVKLPAMYFRRIFAALRCVVVCCLALAAWVGLISPSISKTIRDGVVSAEVKLLNGKTVTLTAPISLKGSYSTTDFTITSLDIRAIDGFASAAPGRLILIQRGTEQRLEVTPHSSA